jgi:PIN domain nuclease of toxin-antitoxin system
MKYLIDTQILIWFQTNDNRLKKSTKEILIGVHNEIIVSTVSLFEIAIKQKVGKLPGFNVDIEDIINAIQKDKFVLYSIEPLQVAKYKIIPFHTDHRDPFDRLLLAIAYHENLPLISEDAKFNRYEELVRIVN